MASQITFYIVAGALLALALSRYFRNRAVARVSAADADRMVRSGEAVFLDVRTESEQRADGIRGALHIPLNELRRRSDELQKHARREIICYCRTGNRSVTAAAILRKSGLRASSLEGGIGEWNYFHLRSK